MKRTNTHTLWQGLTQNTTGSTRRYRDRLNENTDPHTYRQILAVASLILHTLPRGKLGTCTAGLQLAAVAFTEGAYSAWRLVAEERSTPLTEDEAADLKQTLSGDQET